MNIPWICFILGVITVQEVETKCPYTILQLKSNLIQFNGVNYELHLDTTVHGSEASNACKSKGQTLASIPDQATQGCLYQALNSIRVTGRAVWIGLTDSKREGKWTWSSGEPFTYHHWGSGEPGSFLGGNEDCVVMDMATGHWKDYSCNGGFLFSTNRFPYICQQKVAATTTRTTTTKTTTTTATTTTTTTTTSTVPTTTTSTKTTIRTVLASTGMACPVMTCTLDCGLAGFKTDADGCSQCACAT